MHNGQLHGLLGDIVKIAGAARYAHATIRPICEHAISRSSRRAHPPQSKRFSAERFSAARLSAARLSAALDFAGLAGAVMSAGRSLNLRGRWLELARIAKGTLAVVATGWRHIANSRTTAIRFLAS
jgi:hypothetical protein